MDVRNRGDIGAISQVILLSRFDLWGVSAPRDSQEQIHQYAALVRHDHPDLHSGPSFNNDRLAFRRWFICETNHGVSILQGSK